MVFRHLLPVIAAGLALFLNSAQAIPKVSAIGSKFFTDDGKQWFVKGVAYQLSPDDPLINHEQCAVDASLMKQLGANAIRVYHVNPDENHDQCMQIFSDNGIYLFLDLDTFNTAINQDEPSWTQRQYDAYAKVMDAFAKYGNMAGFFVGNEVINTAKGSQVARYVLAAAVDMKKYRDSKKYNKIPVGYSAADIAELRPMLQKYLTCHGEASIDFFALNSYEWCGNNTYQGSGYALLQKQAEGFPVPIWFSETGCNVVRPRTFQDLEAILGPDMNGVWSGAMAYEWIQEANNYGIVSYVKPPTRDDVSTPIPISPDFNELQSRFATLNPTGVALSDYEQQTGTITPMPCPAASADWDLQPDAAIPTLVPMPPKLGTLTSAFTGGTAISTAAADASTLLEAFSSRASSTVTYDLMPNTTSAGTLATVTSSGKPANIAVVSSSHH
ncbi:hypothetical protein KEM54_001844 [Ascosphaera aggregata]|nr:hypothetical protein KEM54_001844 [Ascosphaera aggregata]